MKTSLREESCFSRQKSSNNTEIKGVIVLRWGIIICREREMQTNTSVDVSCVLDIGAWLD